MRRHLMGIIAILLLIGGGAAYWLFPNSSSFQTTAGACVKVGAVLAALWLALPQINKMPLWLYATLMVSVVVLARWPQLWWLVIPAIVMVWVFRPRNSTTDKSPSTGNTISKSQESTNSR